MLNLDFYKEKEQKIIKIYTTIKVVTIIMALLAIGFVNHILTNQRNSAAKYLEQSVMQTSSNLRGRIATSLSELNTLSAKLAANVQHYNDEEISNFLLAHISDHDFHRLVFAYPNGKTIRVQKGVGKLKSDDWSHDERFTRAISGASVFAETKLSDDKPQKYVNEFGIPVHGKDGKINGVLGAQVYATDYLKILGFNNYNKQGFSYIIDKEGNFQIKPLRDKDSAKNFFDRNIKFINKTKEEVQEFIIDEDWGTFLFKYHGQKYIASFALIDSPERYVMTIIPLSVLMLNVDTLLSGLILIVVFICGLLLTLLYYSNNLLTRHEKIVLDIAFVDKVTQYDNKNKFIIKARELIENNPDKKYAMICAEITKFKAMNELFGVENANKILRDFSAILRNNLTPQSTCARDHASTFYILCEYEREEFLVKYFIDKVIDDVDIYNRDSIPEIIKETGVLLHSKLALSFGVYLINDNSVSIEQMCERANIAKRSIDKDVKSHCKFYDDNLRAQLLQEKSIEDEMHQALEENHFQMYIQPKFDLKTKELAGAEALVRWIHPEKGLIPPMNFIPLFEKNGFVTEVDKCIWKQACEFLSARKKEGEKLFPISVNVSRIHMENDKFIDELILLTRKYGIDPKYLELELTETACFNNEKRFEETIHTLKELGFIISMDDFGTGYSSLNMLRNLPIDVLKLDRGFIKDTIQDTRGQIVTKSIIEMANKLNMRTVAEGIETEEQAEFLKQIGCQIAQGFLYGKPVDKESFIELFIPKSQTI